MTCHEKLVAKKKKYDARKRATARSSLSTQDSANTNGNTGINSTNNNGVDLTPTNGKTLNDNGHANPPLQRELLTSDSTSIISEALVNNHDTSSLSQFNTLNTGSESNRTSSHIFQHPNASNSSLRSKVNKSLPPPPRTDSLPPSPDVQYTSRNTTSQTGTPSQSSHIISSTPSSIASRPNKHRSVASGMSAPSIDDVMEIHDAPTKNVYESIEEVNDSDDELNKRKLMRESKVKSATTPQLKGALPLSAQTNQSGSLIFLDIINTDTFPDEPSKTTKDSVPKLQPPLSLSPNESNSDKTSIDKTTSASSATTSDSLGTSSNHEERLSTSSGVSSISNRPHNDVTATSVNGKNILILSPHTAQEPRARSPHMAQQIQSSETTLADVVSTNGTPIAQSSSTNSTTSTDDTDSPSQSFKYPPSSSSSSKLTPKPDSANSKLEVEYAHSRSRSNCSSPLAKANRQARVVEADYINDDMEGDTSTLNDAVTTPVIGNELDYSSYEPSTPSKPTKLADLGSLSLDVAPQLTGNRSGNVARGLGLEGVGDLADYQECIDYLKQQQEIRQRESDSTSTVVNTDTFESNKSMETSNTTADSFSSTTSPNAGKRVLSGASEDQSQQGVLGRRNTFMKSAKIGLRHKRSLSGGNKESSTGKLASFFKSSRINEDPSQNTSNTSSPPTHRRQASESSVHSGSAFATPPLPSPLSHFKDHFRSSSDNSQFLTSFEKISDFQHIPEQDLHREQVAEDVRKLRIERLRLNDQLKEIRLRITQESSKLESLLKDVESLEKKKRSLLDSNIVLTKQNQQLEQVLKLEKQISKDHTSSYDNSGMSNSQTVTILDENEPLETSKATRLKFWRRPKVSLTGTGTGGMPNSLGSFGNNSGYGNQYYQNTNGNMNGNGFANFGNSGGAPMQSSEMLPVPDSEKKGALGTFITKSRSTNILDSFLSGGNNSQLHIDDASNDQAPLFSTTLQKRADYEGTEVPLIITKCLAEVEMRGLDTEGIYRISGGNSAIVAIENAFSGLHPDEPQSMERLEECLSGDINAVTSALKRYLRKLPDPIIPYSLYDDFISISTEIPPNKRDRRIGEMRIRVIDRLPPANRQTVFLLCQHLTRIDSYSQVNRMGFKNLSVVFAPTLAGDINGEKEMLNMGHRNEMTEFLISNYAQIFEE